MNRPDMTDDFGNTILTQYPRLGPKDTFQFQCKPGISCFNACCRDVNIVLTPYDILRMKNGLGLDSEEFLTRYTVIPFTEQQRMPVIFLRMSDNEEKTCPFVDDQGCSIYEDRPWPCRIYPLGLASPKDPATQGEAFHFVIKEDHCKGHEQDKQWTVQQWLADQQIEQYNSQGEEFKYISMHPWLMQKDLDPAKMEMLYMACYNLDKFRRFILNSTFLKRFEVEPEALQSYKDDDLSLLSFAYRFLRLSLFGEQTLTIRKSILTEKEKELYDKILNQ